MLTGVIIGCAIVAVFGVGVLAGGAPFMPTRKIWIDDAMKLAGVGAGDVVVDLGSGDGAVLAAAINRGAKRAVGYEINPILVAWSRLRLRRWRRQCEVREADFFKAKLPRETTVIYLFQVDKVLKKIPRFIADQREDIAVNKLRVVAFGFEIPGAKLVRELRGMRLYEF